jgi:2-methylcitrate dehydratase PrpD
MGLLGAATPAMVTIGWHGSKVLGVYGAAAAAGRILSLTPAHLVNAFGIAGSDAGGGMEYDQSGGEVKRLHAGSACRSGLEAAELAQLGLTGPPTILEGPRGLLRLFSDGGDVEALNAVWDRWLVLDTIVRFYPSVATNHAPLDAIRQLRTKHDIKPADVARIRVGLVDFAVGHGASSAYQAGFRGHPSHPATQTDVEQKFRDNVEGLISTDRADALVALVNGLQTQDSVAPVTALLGVDARRDG